MDESTIQLVGAFESVVMRDNYNGYTIFFLKTRDCVDKLNAKGCVKVAATIPEYTIGTPLRVSGVWDEKAKYGACFKAQKVEECSINKQLLVQYLSSGKFTGISLAIAVKISETFGDSFFDEMSENGVEKLVEKVGMKQDTAEHFVAVLSESKAFHDFYHYVSVHGGSYYSAAKMFEHLGRKAMEQLQMHPYTFGMANGLSFGSCDQIASESGFNAASKERIEHILSVAAKQTATRNGHTYARWPQLVAAAQEILQQQGAFGKKLPTTLLMCGASNSNLVVLEDESGNKINRLDISHIPNAAEDRVYLLKYYLAEKKIAEECARLISSSKELPFAEQYIREAEAEVGMTYAPEQIEAFQILRRTGVAILKGGPGTGKTTVLKGLLSAYRKMYPTGKISLAAPTGRASQRMAESTGREAVTLHRLLEYIPYTEEAHKNAGNPLDGDFIVVDESSMLDVEMAAMLLAAVKDGALVLFVGDTDQLPAVGAGNVLHDMIASDRIPVFSLARVFRQGDGSSIIKNAYNINSGVTTLSQADDFKVVHSKDIWNDIKEIVKKEWDPSDPYSFQILCPTHKSDAGEEFINAKLQENLNPKKHGEEEYQFRKRKFRVGDKVLLTRNNYDPNNEYYNGDVGVITSITPMRIAIGSKTVELQSDQMTDLSLAYAMTVHKSQGSEFKTVMIVLSEAGGKALLKRNLLYTAVTRAKQKVYIIYDGNALRTSIMSNQAVYRQTRLQQRLQSIIPA